jgi:hypothetical protein
MAVLVAARVVQGIGAALLLPAWSGGPGGRHPAIRSATSARIDGMAVYTVPGQSVSAQ